MRKEDVMAKDKEAAEEERRAKAAVEQEKKQAMTDYEKHLEAVREMKAMTDTDAWKALYRSVIGEIDGHAKDILDAEKPREVVQHQEGVKILRSLIRRVREPVGAFRHFLTSMPLLVGRVRVRSEFNEALGTIELKEI